jgi:hypothetical protein
MRGLERAGWNEVGVVIFDKFTKYGKQKLPFQQCVMAVTITSAGQTSPFYFRT